MKPSKYNDQDTVDLVGSGHYQHCLQNMSRIFSFDKCGFSKCSFNGVFQPDVTGNFMVRIPVRRCIIILNKIERHVIIEWSNIMTGLTMVKYQNGGYITLELGANIRCAAYIW